LPKFFLKKEKKDIDEYNLEMWPGFEINTKSVTHGLFLNIDTATKFVNKTTMYEYVDNLIREKRWTKSEVIDLFNPAVSNKRMVVMTSYNSKTYQLDGIDFDKSPATLTFEWEQYDDLTKKKNVVKTNMVEYFNYKYKFKLRDPKEPLLFVHKNNQTIYLPASQCHETALPDDFTKDAFKMRNLATYKISNPTDRADRIFRSL
jgi:hypothetical protein